MRKMNYIKPAVQHVVEARQWQTSFELSPVANLKKTDLILTFLRLRISSFCCSDLYAYSKWKGEKKN